MIKDINEILGKREFIHIASTDSQGRPNVVPKFLLKTEGEFIYLVDYIFGRTWENLKENPRVSLSIMDTESLIGYQVSGTAQIIEEGPGYESMVKELEERETKLSIERVISGVQRGAKHKNFELNFPQRVAIFKIKLEELVEIKPTGQLDRQKL
jgi:predicted pyridoxine 5'-phosphate oxidase superfamily flavin-nucleotide-binding protein